MLDVETMETLHTELVGRGPVQSAFGPLGGRYGLVTHLEEDFVTALDRETGRVAQQIDVGGPQANASFMPDGTTAYVTVTSRNEVVDIDMDNGCSAIALRADGSVLGWGCDFFEQVGAWGWWILGLILLALEIFIPGTFFLWFGVAAIVVGTGALIFDWAWQIQLIAFVALALVLVVVGRRYFGRAKPGDGETGLNERAQNLVGTLQERKGLGRSAIAAELARRLLSPAAIEYALELVDSSDELSRARELARKRAGQLRHLDHDTAVRRLSGYLARRGYGGSTVRAAVEQALPRGSRRGVAFS